MPYSVPGVKPVDYSVIGASKIRRVTVDAFFNTRIEEKSPPASNYWDTDGLHGRGTGIAIYSKKAYKYGVLAAAMKLPALDKEGQVFYFGFENDANVGNGLAYFRYQRIGGVNTLWTGLGGNFHLSVQRVADALVPVDVETAYHDYCVVVRKGGAEFWIDESLVAVAQYSRWTGVTQAVDGPPYGVYGAVAGESPAMMAFVELNAAAGDVTVALNPEHFRVSEGQALPPRVFRLYDAGTTDLFAGLTIAAGSETSHPVPVFGYPGKTLRFQADQAGTLDIEVLMQTGNWRTYDSVTVSADKLLSYIMDGQAVLVRATFTPSTYPATISEAEVVLE